MGKTVDATERRQSRRGLIPSIRARLIISFSLLFVVILVAIELLGLVGLPFTSFSGRVAQEKSEAFRNLNLIADLKKERLLRWLEERRDDAHVIAINPFLTRRVAELLDAIQKHRSTAEEDPEPPAELPGEQARQALAEHLRSVRDTYGAYDRIQIAEVQTGKVFISTDDADIGGDALRFAIPPRALWSNDSILSDVETGPGQTPVFYVLHSIGRPGYRALAMLVMRVSTEDIIGPILHSGRGRGSTEEALLVNSQARILASLKHPLGGGQVAQPLEYQIQAQPAVLAASGEEGIIEAEDYRGEPVLAAYRYIRVAPEFGWGMVVKLDKAKLFAPMWADVRSTALIGLAGIVAVVVLTIVAVRRFTKPILSLSRTADRVAGGDLAARAPITTSDEVGTLAMTFNAMLHQVQHWRQDLEQKVLVRTAELEQANKDLESEIAERKHAQEATRKSEAQYHMLFESMLDAFALHEIICDEKGKPVDYRFLEVNPAFERQTGLLGRDVIGKTVKEVIPGIEEHWIEAYGEVALTGRPIRFESFAAELGRHYEVNAFQPQPGRFAAVFADITDRKSAEESARAAQEQLLSHQRREKEHALQELEKLREQLVRKTRLAVIGQVSASIGHELRNPLGSVRNAAYLLRSRLPAGDAKSAKYVNIIDQEINRADSTIGNLMEMSRPKLPTMQEADLGAIVRAAVAQAGIPDCVQWRMSLQPDPYILSADPEQLRQVLVNLFINAVQAMDGAGEITVDAGRDHVYDAIIVLDSGPGVHAEHRGHLFEPLFSTKAKGTGLGLTICRQIIEQHGGTIELVVKDGCGAAFRIRLPRHGPKGASRAEASDAESRGKRGPHLGPDRR